MATTNPLVEVAKEIKEKVNQDMTNVPIKMTPVLKISLFVLGILILLILVATLFRRSSPLTQLPSISPAVSPVGSVNLPPRQVSEFGKTVDFMNFEDDLNQLKQENLLVNLTEAELTFPLLDMKVSFEK